MFILKYLLNLNKSKFFNKNEKFIAVDTSNMLPDSSSIPNLQYSYLQNNIDLLSFFVSVLLILLALYYALKCTKNDKLAKQMLVVVTAMLFPELYLLYYFIVHFILKHKC